MCGIRVFQLVERLEAGKSARARLLDWNGERYRLSAFAAVRVHDRVGEHGQPGDRGYCFMSEESHHWEVLSGLANPEAVTQRGDVVDRGGQNDQPASESPSFPTSGHLMHTKWPHSSST
jgi:hypothetical protein